VKIGDLIKLKMTTDQFYDWKEFPPGKNYGFFLRDPKNMNLKNERFSKVKFSNDDICLILGMKNNHFLVLNPRFKKGLIHMDKIEVL
jgi:hypothetical protein